MTNLIHAAICDDEILVLPYLSSAIRNAFLLHGFHLKLETFSNGQDFLARAGQTQFAVAFLDIDLPEMDGITLTRRLQEISPGTVCIFVSGREDRVFEAFQTHSFSFVRKSAFQTDLSVTIKDLIPQLLSREDPVCLFQDAQGKPHSLNLNHTLYIEAQDKYLCVVTDQNKELIRYTLSEMERDLLDCQFLRVHKSYLVNHRFVHCLNAEQVVLENGQSLPLSRRRAAQVRKQFIEFSTLPKKEAFPG